MRSMARKNTQTEDDQIKKLTSDSVEQQSQIQQIVQDLQRVNEKIDQNQATNTSQFAAIESMFSQLLNQRSTAESSDQLDEWLKERHVALQLIKDNLVKARDRMKKQADKNRVERSFDLGTMVYLKLQPYRQTSVSMTKGGKLRSRYFGPFEVTEKIGAVAYRLQLPPGSQIHPVFHVSQLKRKMGTKKNVSSNLPLVGPEGVLKVVPIAVKERRMVKKDNRAAVQLRIQWSNLPAEETTWEDYDELLKRFPEFKP